MRTRVWASRLGKAAAVAVAAFLVSTVLPPPAQAAAVPVVSHGSRTKPYIALTIDDGYNASNEDLATRADVIATRDTWRHAGANAMRVRLRGQHVLDR